MDAAGAVPGRRRAADLHRRQRLLLGGDVRDEPWCMEVHCSTPAPGLAGPARQSTTTRASRSAAACGAASGTPTGSIVVSPPGLRCPPEFLQPHARRRQTRSWGGSLDGVPETLIGDFGLAWAAPPASSRTATFDLHLGTPPVLGSPARNQRQLPAGLRGDLLHVPRRGRPKFTSAADVVFFDAALNGACSTSSIAWTARC